MKNEVSRKKELENMSKEELVELALNLEHNEEIYLEALKSLRNKTFKSTSESSNNMQLNLFNEIEETLDHSNEEDLKEVITYVRSKKKKTKVDYSNLEVRTIHHELKDLSCPICNTKLKELKPEIIERLIYKKAEYYIEKHVIHNYVCQKCSNDNDTLVTYKSNDKIIKPIKGSIISSSIVSQIAYDKFILDIPLYRQEADLKRRGINITRQNMSNWLSIIERDYLRYIFDKMHDDIKGLKYLHADETTLKVLEEKDKEKSYEWLLMSGKSEEKKMALYFYHHSREYVFLDEIIGDFKGYLHSDGYGAYQNKKFTNIGCFAHVRRKFIDAYYVSNLYKQYEKLNNKDKVEFANANPSFHNVLKAIKYIDDLFDLEKNRTVDTRKNQSEPLVNKFFDFIRTLDGKYPYKSKMGIAITYALNQEKQLRNYLLDINLEISNNLAEQRIKPFVMARKNFLFSNTKNGAKTSSIYFSLIESAKMNNLDPYKYLIYVIDEICIKGLKPEVIESLLPYSSSLPNELYTKRKPTK